MGQDVDVAEAHAQLLGGDLRHGRVRALAHVQCGGDQRHGALVGELDERFGRVVAVEAPSAAGVDHVGDAHAARAPARPSPPLALPVDALGRGHHAFGHAAAADLGAAGGLVHGAVGVARGAASSGSMPIFSASSSSCDSVANATCGLPKPRNAVPISLLV